MTKNEENETKSIDPDAPNLTAIFKKYTNPSGEEGDKKEIKESKKVEEKKEVKKEIDKEEPLIEEKTKEPDLKSEIEKLQRNLKETRKWGTDTKRQLDSYKKIVEKFKEEGNLSEEEATELLNHTKYEELDNKDKSFLEKAAEVWDREIENIRKYSDYPELDKHLHAFQHFLHNGTKEEVEEAYEDIKDIIDSNPVLFTKKMLEIGKRYHDDIFGDLVTAGNLKNFKRQYEDKLESSQKKIEKLEKEIAKLKDKYEGYDENPNYRMPQGGSSGESGIDPSVTKRPGRLIEDFLSGKHKLS